MTQLLHRTAKVFVETSLAYEIFHQKSNCVFYFLTSRNSNVGTSISDYDQFLTSLRRCTFVEFGQKARSISDFVTTWKLGQNLPHLLTNLDVTATSQFCRHRSKISTNIRTIFDVNLNISRNFRRSSDVTVLSVEMFAQFLTPLQRRCNLLIYRNF